MTFPIPKRKALLLVGAIVLTLGALAAWLLPELLSRPQEAALIVNGEVITRAEFNEAFQELLDRRRAALTGQERLEFERQLAGAPGAYYQLTLKSKLAEELIRRALLEQAARQMGIKIRQSELLREVRLQLWRFLERSGATQEQIERALEDPKLHQSPFTRELRERLYWQLLQDRLRQRIAGRLNPTEAELRRYYQRYRLRYHVPELVHVRHILIRVPEDAPEQRVEAARARIEQLYELVQQGADFAELARRHSQDPLSAPNGGDYGWIQRGDPTGEEFVAAAFALQEPGEVSRPVRTKRGFHLIQLLERRPARGETFEEVAAEVRLDYIREKTGERYQAWYESYRGEAEIRIELPILRAYRLEAQDPKAALKAYEEVREQESLDDPYLGYYIARLYRLELDGIERELEDIEATDETERLQKRARELKEKIAQNLKEVLSQVKEREIYEAILEIDPQDSETRFAFADFLLGRGRWEEAAEQLERTLAADPDHAAAQAAYGQLLLEMRRFAEAAVHLERALTLAQEKEERLKLRLALAEAYHQLGQQERAREVWQNVLHDDPANKEAHLGLAQLARTAGDLPEALRHLEAALEAAAESEEKAKLWVEIGRLHLSAGELEEAEQVLLRALQEREDLPEAYLSLGDLFRRRGNAQRALEHYRRGFSHAVGWEVKEQLGLRILELEPRDTELRFELAELYVQRRRFEEALEHYLELTEYLPRDLRAWRALGDVYVELERYDQAVQAYEKGLEHAADDGKQAGLWVKIYFTERRRAQADAGSLSPKGLEALYQLASLNAARGEYEDAAKYLRLLLEADPAFRAEGTAQLIEQLRRWGIEVRQPED